MTKEAICKWFEGDNWQYESGWEKVQPLTRCKDCKHYRRNDRRTFIRGSDCSKEIIDTIVPDKDFCSRAERKEE